MHKVKVFWLSFLLKDHHPIKLCLSLTNFNSGNPFLKWSPFWLLVSMIPALTFRFSTFDRKKWYRTIICLVQDDIFGIVENLRQAELSSWTMVWGINVKVLEWVFKFVSSRVPLKTYLFISWIRGQSNICYFLNLILSSMLLVYQTSLCVTKTRIDFC